MRYLLIACLLCGCVADPSVDQAAKPKPPVTGSAVEAAAEKCIRDYAEGVADAHDATAARVESGEFKGNGDVFAAGKPGNEAAFKAAGKGYSDALNVATGAGDANVKYDPAVTGKALRDAAKGFRKAVKK